MAVPIQVCGTIGLAAISEETGEVDAKTALWLLGVLFLPFIWNQVRLYQMVKHLEEMHLDPDKHGLGTGDIPEVIESNTVALTKLSDCMEDMTMVVRWLSKKMDGDSPPPRIRKPS